MSFYGLIISVILALCVLQVSMLVCESQSAGTINVAYYQTMRSISSSMPR